MNPSGDCYLFMGQFVIDIRTNGGVLEVKRVFGGSWELVSAYWCVLIAEEWD